jgi:hypothetical protein
MRRIWILLFFALFVNVSLAEDTQYLEWSNDYLRIFVTQTEQEMGRFAVDTTLGDHTRDEDNNKPLIYGHPIPWTSYTTIRVEEVDYVFGGPTERRAGADGVFGSVLEPPHLEGEEIVTVFSYQGIQAEQRIGICTNPYSGWNDTARIRYRIRNTELEPKSIGLRIVLDTMLGSNDGAPFRVGGDNIANPTRLGQAQLPDVWQAFDSLSAPSVIAQGILKGYGVSAPDRVAFVDWGTAADHLWDLVWEEGQDFTRAGEFEPDTAIALYWEPSPTAPGATREFTILYGLGGVTMAPGASFLGMAAPSEVVYDPGNERVYQILTYVENNTPRLANNVQVRLKTPRGIRISGAPSSMLIPRMEPHETKQILWSIKADGKAFGSAQIVLEVTGDDLKNNSLKHSVRIVGPPVLRGKFSSLKVEDWHGEPLRFETTVYNTGGSTAFGVWADIDLASGARLAKGDNSRKYLADLAPGEKASVHWWILPERSGNVNVNITAGYHGGRIKLGSTQINLPVLQSRLHLESVDSVILGEAFCLEVVGDNLPPLTEFSLDFKYDPNYFLVLRVAKGRFSLEGSPISWSTGTNDIVKGIIRGVSASRQEPISEAKTSLARFFLVPIRPGDSELSIEKLQLLPKFSGNMPVYTPRIRVKIKEAKS